MAAQTHHHNQGHSLVTTLNQGHSHVTTISQGHSHVTTINQGPDDNNSMARQSCPDKLINQSPVMKADDPTQTITILTVTRPICIQILKE
jgi:hypothetical protein